MTLRAGIFGYPIAHSISPAMHNAAFARIGFDATYEAWETPPDALAASVSRLRDGGYLGANVTVPHKRAVMDCLDETDDIAARIGAVNTIVIDGVIDSATDGVTGGRLLGTNTDAYGFIRSLELEAGVEVSGMDVALAGAGGAARAAAYGLAAEGIDTLYIANRTLERARTLADEMAAQGIRARAVALSSSSFADICRHADLLVNTTSIGMLHGPAEGESPVPVDALRPGLVVYDMVYNPSVTPLLSAAQDAGATCVGGLTMLVHQGAAAFERWTGAKAPADTMLAAARDALGL